jgi:uncharacterized protein (DUF2235 family)
MSAKKPKPNKGQLSKRIIFCADGTWDTAQNHTNVYKLYKSLPITAGQIPFYDDGVGTSGTPLEKLVGGAFGEGLFQKIKDGYTKISHVYEKDDDLFLFGFSRGAYTARCLAGMIAICGLPTESFGDNLVGTAFQAYRDKTQRTRLLASLSGASLYNAKIKMVGVWDTVGSLGIPAIFGGVDPVRFGFLDTGLHPDVLNAFQALAIDERRREFPPTLWTSTPATGQVLEQVWFCGPHCDVGGGYAETQLSDITLSWMMSRARSLGLEIDGAIWAHYSSIPSNDALGEIHDSWNLFWGIPSRRQIAAKAALGNSVAVRCQRLGSYRPQNLTFTDGAPSDTYQTVQVV